jgi:hypothetical protein
MSQRFDEEYPRNRVEGVNYTLEFADRLWLVSLIGVSAIFLSLVFYLMGKIDVIVIGVVIFFVICFVIFTILTYSGCLKYLKAEECLEIVKNHIRLKFIV